MNEYKRICFYRVAVAWHHLYNAVQVPMMEPPDLNERKLVTQYPHRVEFYRQKPHAIIVL